MSKWILIPIIIWYQVSTAQENNTGELKSSNAKGPPIHNRLSTKTPYDYVANKNISNLNTLRGDTCRPAQIWLVVRHGTRYPTISGIRALKHEIPVLIEKISKNRSAARYVDARRFFIFRFPVTLPHTRV